MREVWLGEVVLEEVVREDIKMRFRYVGQVKGD